MTRTNELALCENLDDGDDDHRVDELVVRHAIGHQRQLKTAVLRWDLFVTGTALTYRVANELLARAFKLAASGHMLLPLTAHKESRFNDRMIGEWTTWADTVWHPETHGSIQQTRVPIELDLGYVDTKPDVWHAHQIPVLGWRISFKSVSNQDFGGEDDDALYKLILRLLTTRHSSTGTTLTVSGSSIVFIKRASTSLFHLLFFIFWISLNFAGSASAAFTHEAVYHLDQVRPNPSGTYCFHPRTLPGRLALCVDQTLSTLLDIHVNNAHGSGLSIAYYDTHDLTVLGGADWSEWNTTNGRAGVCLSGAVEGIGGSYLTVCRFAAGDDDHSNPAAQAIKCVIDRPQQRVVDGCYAPPIVQIDFKLNGRTDAAFAIVGLAIAILTLIWAVLRRIGRRFLPAHPNQRHRGGRRGH